MVKKKDGQYFENRKRRYRKIAITIIISLLIISALAIMFIIYQLNNINYSDFKVMESIERSDNTSTYYTNYNGGILRYSKDGATFMNLQGESIWNSTYGMNAPISDVCDEYVVISDFGNKKLELFNGSGHITSLEVLYPIIKAEIASQGVVAVLMDGGNVNHIQLFSSTGQNLTESRTTVEKHGFAVDFSISDDGRKLVTSYISINAGLIQSKITFYNFGPVGQNYESKVVGGFDYGQTLAPKVEFVDSDNVVVFGDDKFSIYKMEEIPNITFEETFQTEIKSIDYNENNIGIIQKNIDGDDKYLLTVYDLKGDKVLIKEISYNYEYFSLINKELIFRSNKELNVVRLNGKEKINYSFDKDVDYVFPMPLKDEYLIIDQSNIYKIKLVK